MAVRSLRESYVEMQNSGQSNMTAARGAPGSGAGSGGQGGQSSGSSGFDGGMSTQNSIDKSVELARKLNEIQSALKRLWGPDDGKEKSSSSRGRFGGG